MPSYGYSIAKSPLVYVPMPSYGYSIAKSPLVCSHAILWVLHCKIPSCMFPCHLMGTPLQNPLLYMFPCHLMGTPLQNPLLYMFPCHLMGTPLQNPFSMKKTGRGNSKQ